MSIVSPKRRRAQALQAALEASPEPRVYYPSALVANPSGTVDYEDLPFAVNCLLEEVTHLFKQMTGAPPKKRPRVTLTASSEF